MNRSTPGLPVHHQLPEFTQIHLHLVSMPSSHLILCRPLLLLPPIPPSIRVFSNESALPVRWPKYWSFSFSIIPSKEIPGLISFRMDWLDLLARLQFKDLPAFQSHCLEHEFPEFRGLLINLYVLSLSTWQIFDKCVLNTDLTEYRPLCLRLIGTE